MPHRSIDSKTWCDLIHDMQRTKDEALNRLHEEQKKNRELRKRLAQALMFRRKQRRWDDQLRDELLQAELLGDEGENHLE